MWVWGGGCREVGVSVGVWEVGAGRWVWVTGVGNPVHVQVQKFTYLEPDSIISSLFVQSVIICHTLCGLLNKLVGYVCEEVGVGRWVWLGGCGCGEVGVGRWVWEGGVGGGCGCGEVGLVIGR